MEHLDNIKGRELVPGFISKLVHGENSTLSIVEIEKGCTMPVHQHPHEQVTYITDGELEMTIGGELYLFTSGMVHVIPPNTPHGAFARTAVRVIDFFSPARDDYK
jgi:quercetin dioxygenase-like cupin family protein